MMNIRHVASTLLGAIAAAGVSLSAIPAAHAQSVCEKTAAPGDTDLDADTTKTNVDFQLGMLQLVDSTACGEVISDPVDLAALSLDDVPMNITAVRLVTDFTGDVQFFVSTAEPAEWVPTHDCDGPGGPQDLEFCARIPMAAGRSLRWKAVMCPNPFLPFLYQVAPVFDYSENSEFGYGGITFFDGVAYYGSYSQPGDVGQLYATSADFNTSYWLGRERLREQLTVPPTLPRSIYTSVGDTSRTPFEIGNTALVSLFGVASSAEADAVVQWVRDSERFLNTAVAPNVPTEPIERRFGGIVTSTPAVLRRTPPRPVWYTRVDPLQRGEFDTFNADVFSDDRLPLVLYGAKDGMVHAVLSDPLRIEHPNMGRELWAYIPPSVAARMDEDFDASQNQGKTIISAYPDSSPVIDDVRLSTGFATVAVLPEGKGGQSISVIDITNSATGLSTGTPVISGPQPMWTRTPGGLANAGLALNQPAIARAQIGSDIVFLVIAGTGVAFDDPTYQKGRTVAAYDIETGDVKWTFQTECPLTTPITVFETDDTDEPAGAVPIGFDGIVDRAVFADRCGYVYKVDINQDALGGPIQGIGGISTPGGQLALFWTNGRPVAGNIAARAVVDDSTTRVALFFGTGGLEDFPTFTQNFFYAIPASPESPGETFGTIEGDCPFSTRCEKFYGGATLSDTQVVYARVLEPVIGFAADCPTGTTPDSSTTIEALSLLQDVNDTDFLNLDASKTMNGMLKSALVVYSSQANGRLSTGETGDLGNRGTKTAGGDTANGTLPDTKDGTAGEGSAPDPNAPVRILGWRQVF